MTGARYWDGDIAKSCAGCPSGPYEPCDPSHPHDGMPGTRAQRLGWRLVQGLESTTDALAHIWPFSLLDALLRGPVGPQG